MRSKLSGICGAAASYTILISVSDAGMGPVVPPECKVCFTFLGFPENAYTSHIEVFFVLIGKLLPLYIFIGIGFVGGKFLNISRETVARLLIYILSPLIVFYGIMTIDIQLAVLLLPVTYFLLSIVTCLLGYFLASRFWKDTHKNILGFATGTGNTGYFGFPVAVAIFGERVLGLMILGSFGAIIYECTIGFFLVARGHHGIRDSVMRVVKLPTMYAAVIAIACNLGGLPLPDPINDIFLSVRGAYTILGSMMVGLGLSGVSRWRIDWLFTGIAFFMKFLIWPVLMYGVLRLDASVFHLFSEDMRNVLFLLSIVPMAANTVAFATELRTEPEKAATAVFLSTAFALFYIPLMVAMVF